MKKGYFHFKVNTNLLKKVCKFFYRQPKVQPTRYLPTTSGAPTPFTCFQLTDTTATGSPSTGAGAQQHTTEKSSLSSPSDTTQKAANQVELNEKLLLSVCCSALLTNKKEV